ncbi:MAG TPA: homoserine O-succinyltransferase [Steroidobacteraceae bacterium]|jgi:homoserine O-acetyltransferase
MSGRVEPVPVSEGVLELPDVWALHHGGVLRDVHLAWRLSGVPEAPLVCAMGGVWCDRRLYEPDDPRRGCWREIVGPGRPLDADRHRILSFDYIAGKGESTGPRAGGDFPSVSTYDQADALARLLDHLKVRELRAIVGGSYGGMVALAFAERYPERVGALVTISAADQPHPMAVAWHSIQRHIVRFAIGCGRGPEGLQLARAVGMSTYRSSEEFAARFPPLPRLESGRFVFPVEQYLFADNSEWVAGLRPEAFLALSESLDLHRVDAARIFVPTSAVAAREDQLVPLSDVRGLGARLGNARVHEISSIYGHDAYLRESEQLRKVLASWPS